MDQPQEQQFLRVSDIVGDPNADPPKPAIIPVSTSCWYAWVKSGVAPRAIKIGRASFWRKVDVLAMMDSAR